MFYSLPYIKQHCSCGNKLYGFFNLKRAYVGPPVMKCTSCNNLVQTPFKLWKDLDVTTRKRVEKHHKRLNFFFGIAISLPLTILITVFTLDLIHTGQKSFKDFASLLYMFVFTFFIFLYVYIKKKRLKKRIHASEADYEQQVYESKDFFNW